MGEDRGNRLKFRAPSPVPGNSKTPDINLILSRWQIGCRITPQLMEKTKEALQILEEIRNAAETDKRYTNVRYQGKASREMMRDAELMRSESMLHAVEVTRLLILRAFEQDDPQVLHLAVSAAWVMKDHILERGFFRLDEPKTPVAFSPIRKIEQDPETKEGWAKGLRQRIERTYRQFIYEPLVKPCKDMGILLCPFEQFGEGTPMPPVLTISNA